LGISDILEVHINSIGCNKDICRPKFINDLKDFYIGKERSLCENCVKRMDKNPMRLLDCKEEDCKILAAMAPKLKDYLCDECVEFHSDLKEFLKELEIPFVENEMIVRGLDYYTNTVFEFWDKTRGAQNAVLGGGRYDGLVEIMGGEPTPAVGWAGGVERLIANMKEKGIKAPHKDDIHVFVAQLGKEAKQKCLKIIKDLREAGKNCWSTWQRKY
jgi:histidyl-tRNA synthetase